MIIAQKCNFEQKKEETKNEEFDNGSRKTDKFCTNQRFCATENALYYKFCSVFICSKINIHL